MQAADQLGSDGRRRRAPVRERSLAGAAAVSAAALILLAGCTDSGSEEGTGGRRRAATTTTTPSAPDPGERFDGEGLPGAVSGLTVLDDGLIAYYAAGRDGRLDVVAVDLDGAGSGGSGDPDSAGSGDSGGRGEATVRWRQPAALPYLGGDEVASLVVADGAVVVLEQVGDGFRAKSVGADGAVRWRVDIETPTALPERCGERACVETRLGPVAIDPATGEHEEGPEPSGRSFASSVDQVLRFENHPDGVGGDRVRAVPRFAEAPRWDRPVTELFGRDGLTEGFGQVVGDQWVVSLDLDEDRDAPYPRTFEPGVMAGMSVADGAPRWVRPGLSPCLLPIAEDLLVACNLEASLASEDEGWDTRLTDVTVLDPKTGTDRLHLVTEPYGIGEGDRFALAGPDRLAVRTPAGIQVVDVRFATAEPAGPRPVAWCRPDGHLPKVRDREGDLVELSTVAMGRPCTVDGAKATEDELLAPVVDGRLPPVPLASVVRVGDWVLWNVDGRVTGVAVEP